MSTLAYYTTLLKKEEILKRLGEDASVLAEIANDLVCEIKTTAAACKNRDVETIISSTSQAENLVKVVGAMLDNLKGNTNAYVNTLVPQQEQSEQKEATQEKQDASQTASEKLTSLVDALKSLKEMQSSIGANESSKV
jgi:Sec-independent protein translocase protein TatA